MPRAFTLVELLVVITVSIILLALLVPALDRAMSAAESARCMTNLRTWSLAMRQYTFDYKGHTPDTTTTARNYWWAYLAPYVGEPDFQTRRPHGWIKANICPSSAVALHTGATLPNGGVAGIPRPTNTTYWGSARKVWQWGNPEETRTSGPTMVTHYAGTVGSYGMNLWLMPHDDTKWNPQANYWGRYVNAPGDAVLLGDAIWVGGWPSETDSPPVDTENGNASTEGNGWYVGGVMGRWVINRHQLGNMAINTGYVDGSAQHVRLGALWTLRWHKNWMASEDYLSEYE